MRKHGFRYCRRNIREHGERHAVGGIGEDARGNTGGAEYSTKKNPPPEEQTYMLHMFL